MEKKEDRIVSIDNVHWTIINGKLEGIVCDGDRGLLVDSKKIVDLKDVKKLPWAISHYKIHNRYLGLKMPYNGIRIYLGKNKKENRKKFIEYEYHQYDDIDNKKYITFSDLHAATYWLNQSYQEFIASGRGKDPDEVSLEDLQKLD